ncbi:MAG TPA: hemerythrin domain-containing protein [Candidatus Marinimicrobia bacterium]|nr:hemerythrin domain-containing protein [Candidatus Neomarinimicrobiota bacterium]
MKREKFLEILSWEHHDGLVIALRLEKGLENGTELWLLKDYLLDKWNHALKDHFQSEERYLIQPAQYYEPDSAPIQKMMQQHEVITKLVETILDKANKANIEKFIAALRQHIQFEEKELFPYLESLLEPELKDKIAQCLSIHYVKGDKGWDPEFWKT